MPDAVLDAFCFGVFQGNRATHPVILFTPSHYLSLFVSILFFLIRFITGQGAMSSNTFTLGTKSVNRLGYGA
ncbi:hypothetical protein ACTK65_003843, partial [Escherichia coli]